MNIGDIHVITREIKHKTEKKMKENRSLARNQAIKIVPSENRGCFSKRYPQQEVKTYLL